MQWGKIMRVLLQRVNEASVSVESKTVSRIGNGLLLFVGVTHTDTEKEIGWMAKKVAGLRIFEDEEGKLNKSLADVGGGILAVSQFTLYGETRKGRRPSFVEAARPEKANPLFDSFCESLEREGACVKKGVFGAHMAVTLVNDGPVTLMLEREANS